MSCWLIFLVRRATAPTCVLMLQESAAHRFPWPSRAEGGWSREGRGKALAARSDPSLPTPAEEVPMSTTLSPDEVGTRRDARAGARAMLPIVTAYAPLGLVVGAHVAASDSPVAAWLVTWLIYGGAAQLAVLDVLAHDPGWVSAAAVGVLVNLRLAAYAPAMGPELRTAPRRLRVAAALILTDAPWALARTRTRGAQAYYF